MPPLIARASTTSRFAAELIVVENRSLIVVNVVGIHIWNERGCTPDISTEARPETSFLRLGEALSNKEWLAI
jgi:hypothetical protein